MKVYLGLDTSCYTTSCALVNSEGEIIGEAKKLLEVKAGARGLQQSQMVFQHTRALPELIKQLPSGVQLAGIGVSAFPRREKDSYMPAFLVGRGMAHSLGHLQNIPVYEFSHQENHILAALRDLKYVPTEPFYGLHVSGGTTELLYCEPSRETFFTATLVSDALDLHGGQFVDRIGVALDLPFPAGPHMENLAKTICTAPSELKTTMNRLIAESENKEAIQNDSHKLGDLKNNNKKQINFDMLPVSVKKGQISFGGPCSEAMRRIERATALGPLTDNYKAQMALAVFHCMSRSLQKMLTYHFEMKPAKTLIAVGGVMANSYLRQALLDFGHKEGVNVLFAPPQYSSDNATGVAYGAALLDAVQER